MKPNPTPYRFGIFALQRKSFRFNLLPNLAVIASIALSTAVIVGALLVGDSVRGSLKNQALDRLGKIDGLMLTRGFIGLDSIQSWKAAAEKKNPEAAIHPFLLFASSTAEVAIDSDVRRSSNIIAMGIPSDFWQLSSESSSKFPGPDEVVVNEELAQDLNLAIGDEITLRIPTEQAVPADSPLGRRDGQTIGIPRLKIVDIVPAKGLGRFDIRNNQRIPRNLFLDLNSLQEKIDRENKVNAVAISLNRPDSAIDLQQDTDKLNNLLTDFQPSLQDLRLKLLRPTIDNREGQPVYSYYSLTSDEMILDPKVQRMVMDSLPRGAVQPVFTYLANAIAKTGDTKEVTYSTITGIDSSPSFPLSEESGMGERTILQKDQVVINSWLAQQLNAQVGDRLKLWYFLPETVHGQEVEESFEVDVVGIAPLTEPASPYRRNRPAKFEQLPTLFNDPALTPDVPGITDQDSINDWETPFALTRTVSAEDDRYWNNHRLTPKLFMSYEATRDRFGSRFGLATSLRIQTDAAKDIFALEESILASLRPHIGDLDFKLNAIKAEALQASSGTTPFDGLFLGLSLLVIGSALMLIALLFRLSIDQRAEQWGLYSATGWTWSSLRRLLLSEGLMLSLIGALLGVPLGILYAKIILAGLSGWWLGAVTVAFLSFYMTTPSLLIGVISGTIVSLLAIYVAMRALRKLPAITLLRGKTEIVGSRQNRLSTWLGRISLLVWLSGFALALVGLTQSGQVQAGLFVGGGMVLLLGAMGLVHVRLQRWQQGDLSRKASGNYSLLALAMRTIGRNPLRSTLTLGLLAVTSFLILSLSAFQIRPSLEAAGGFSLVGESSTPIYQNIGDPAVRRDYLGPPAETLSQATIFAFKMRPGDEASCNNLYQAREPKIVGISSLFAEWEKNAPASHRFKVSSKRNANAATDFTPWTALQNRATGTQEDPLPVILDLNTAMWSLHLKAQIDEVFSFKIQNREIHFKTVGLLNNSLLQGMLLIGENNFQTSFPDLSGFQFFLATETPITNKGTPPSKLTRQQLTDTLEKGWGDEGLDITQSEKVLEQLLAVQNTYLKAFQSLGALGLLLGTIGLAIVQVRSVLERRSELATLRAIGFKQSRIGQLILLENCILLLGGIMIGGGTAIVCVAAPLLQNAQFTELMQPLAWLGVVLVVGLAAGAIAVRTAARQPLLSALRQR